MSRSVTIRRTRSVLGSIDLPADKSIAHRAALLAALGDGTSRLVNYPEAADPQSTLSVLRQLGVEIEEESEGILRVAGRGLRGLQNPGRPLDCGNAGTLMRLIAGILAGQSFDSTLVGDVSLSSRPMGRIVDPLEQMGAEIAMQEGHAPLVVRGGRPLTGITYRLPVASAQVKSCVLLAGLYADGETTVVETTPSRDHTERMLGLDVVELGDARHISVRAGRTVSPRTWSIPRDFSAAAFFLVAGSIVEAGELRLSGVGINPSRSAMMDVLRAMGANISMENEREHGGEPIADLVVRPAELHGVSVDGGLIPNLIDEIPVLAVAATRAEGRTEIRDAGELRVKETDRIDAMASNLRAMGAAVEEFNDGLAIEGGRALQGAVVDAFDDHRIAMAMGVAGLVAAGETTVTGAEAATISFPGFWEILAAAAGA